MRAKLINEGRYEDQSSKYNAEYEYYWGKLVPLQGEAETLQGEILRMMVRIMYDYYNNGFGNDRKYEAEFLDDHSKLFKLYMRNPKIWDIFYELYEEISFGSWNERWKKAQEAASYASSRSGGGYNEEDEEYEDPDDYMEHIDDFIKNNEWNIEDQMDDIMDGIIQYIRMTEDNLQPLQQSQED